jgi:hypothetical protein
MLQRYQEFCFIAIIFRHDPCLIKMVEVWMVRVKVQVHSGIDACVICAYRLLDAGNWHRPLQIKEAGRTI